MYCNIITITCRRKNKTKYKVPYIHCVKHFGTSKIPFEIVYITFNAKHK